MATLRGVDSEASFDQTIKDAAPSTLFVLYFHTPWAAPCAQMNTILSTLASTYPADSDISFLSINAEELADVSESYDVTAVPFLVLQKGGKTLETVSGSDATKVRAAVEKYAGTGNKSGGVPPPLQATPQQQNGHVTSNEDAPTTTKDLSSYAPKNSDPQTAPDFSGNAGSREELDERLGKLVKAAPVMLFMKGTPSAPQCGFSRQLVSILRENQVKYGYVYYAHAEVVLEGMDIR
ncbi:monothiol glutaredoxin [Exophiala viscosa]|uniref:monothiol glutaredoxin n=1 Tax=Exophiala viscosa TaxID=2486360 RepID=UPI0021999333|nr:monothiol glutaredoxin [Exophiala viscosa]